MSDNTLTSAERLIVKRRRAGLNQREAAREFGVSQSRYSRWERGLEEPPFLDGVTRRMDQLQPHERCLMHRRRAGLTQAQVAHAMGRCKMWVRQMERGEVPCTELVQWWEK